MNASYQIQIIVVTNTVVCMKSKRSACIIKWLHSEYLQLSVCTGWKPKNGKLQLSAQQEDASSTLNKGEAIGD